MCNNTDKQIQNKEDREKWERCRKRFYEIVSRKYSYQCKREGIEPTPAGLLEYANRCRIIPNTTVVKYMVIEDYPEHLYKADGKKRRAIGSLEVYLPIKERTIWATLKEGQKQFRYCPK